MRSLVQRSSHRRLAAPATLSVSRALLLRPSSRTISTWLRIGGEQRCVPMGPVPMSFAHARRGYRVTPCALRKGPKGSNPESMAATAGSIEDDAEDETAPEDKDDASEELLADALYEEEEEETEEEKERRRVRAQLEAAAEAKKRETAYERWLYAVRSELQKIQEQVLQEDEAKNGEDTGEENKNGMTSNYDSQLRLLQNIFLEDTSKDKEAPPTEKKEERLYAVQYHRKLVTFEGEQKKPKEMPYLLLDPDWYRNTTEEERLQQVLAWRPFTQHAKTMEKASAEFKEDPFRNKNDLFSGPTITDNFRRKRLAQYLSEELATKRTVASDTTLNQLYGPKSQDQVKKEFGSNLAMMEMLDTDLEVEHLEDVQVSNRDKYIKPEGFQSASDLFRLNEQKLEAEMKNPKRKPKKCIFCQPTPKRPVLDPMNFALLAMFVTPAGDLITRRYNGNCSRHQRKLASTIRRAKHMGIFSYKYGGFTIHSPFTEPPNLDPEPEFEDEAQESEIDQFDEDEHFIPDYPDDR